MTDQQHALSDRASGVDPAPRAAEPSPEKAGHGAGEVEPDDNAGRHPYTTEKSRDARRSTGRRE